MTKEEIKKQEDAIAAERVKNARETIRLGSRLRGDIVAISKASNTSGRAVLDKYLQFITTSPFVIQSGSNEFPVPVRGHPKNPERTTAQGQFNVLCFHIGSAILGYYSSLLMCVTRPEFYRRSDLIHEIAAIGLEKFTVAGSLAEGFYLSNLLTDRMLEKKYAVHAEPPKQN